jgi:hypothetical protein
MKRQGPRGPGAEGSREKIKDNVFSWKVMRLNYKYYFLFCALSLGPLAPRPLGPFLNL